MKRNEIKQYIYIYRKIIKYPDFTECREGMLHVKAIEMLYVKREKLLELLVFQEPTQVRDVQNTNRSSKYKTWKSLTSLREVKQVLYMCRFEYTLLYINMFPPFDDFE